MKYRHPAWAVLEIEPTSDTRAIRTAYTRKLKAIDPETDPQGFIALREAFDAAQVQAQWVDLPDEDEDEDYDWDAEAYSDAPAPGYSYNPITGIATPLAEAQADDKYRALADFLLPGGKRREGPASEADARDLNALFDTALADPRMEQVGFHADAERWCADILARAWPASGPVLLRAARHFGWDEGADPSRHITPAVDFINARLRDAGLYGDGAATDPAIRPATGSAPDGPNLEYPFAAPSFEGEGEPAGAVPLPGAGPEWQAPDTTPASPWAAITPEQADAHAGALANLLYTGNHGEGQWATPEQCEAMMAHWRALTADPRLHEVAYFADAERWFSELIARTVPFSDSLVVPATRFFGWLTSDGEISQSWALATLTARYRMLEFMAAVREPGHPLNPAWRELCKPAGEGSWRGRVNGRNVRRLLATVRRDYPDLEGCFDGYRVALWEKTGGGGGFNLAGWIGPTLFVLFLLVRACTSTGESDSRPLPPPVEVSVQSPLETADAALDVILKDMLGDGIDMATITKRNLPLAVALKAQWLRDREADGPSFTLDPNVRALLRSWYTNGISKADAGLLADHFRMVIDVARTLSATSPENCVRFLESSRVSGPNFAFSEALLEREKALMARTLLSTGAPPPNAQAPGRSFIVPGDVVADAAKRARFSDDQIRKAITATGPIARQCTGNIALMEVILALPRKRGLPLMREM